MMINKEEAKIIQEKFQSLCYSCNHARRPASISNIKSGWVGCRLKHKYDTEKLDPEDVYYKIKEAESVGEGWVYLRSTIFGKPIGGLTNMQLVTFKVSSCEEYSNEKV